MLFCVLLRHNFEKAPKYSTSTSIYLSIYVCMCACVCQYYSVVAPPGNYRYQRDKARWKLQKKATC